nr:MAG: fiber protein [unidentified adenovirus]
MNRAVPADFNPVYPYDRQNRNLNLMPPFYNGDGFEDGPTSVLTLDCENPISTETGKLGLKVGPGLDVNAQGQLQTTGNSAPLVNPPINYTDGRVGLTYAPPLSANSSNALALNLGQGLAINNVGELENTALNSYTFANPLVTDAQNQVSLTTENPISTTGGNLSLLKSNQFGVDSQGALTHTTPFPPLEFDTSGALQLKTAFPLQVETTTRSLGLKIGTGLAVDADNSLYVTPASGGGGANVTAAPPLTLNNDQLALTIGNGLKLDNDTLVLNRGPGLYFATGQLSIDIGDGLTYNGNQVRCKPGTGLELGATTIKIAQPITPLTFSGDRLFLDTGFGLTQLSGKLVLEYGGHYTLWTTPDPSPNCQIGGTTLNTKLWLALTLSEGLVIGTIAVEGLADNTDVQQGNPKTITLIFAEDGVLSTVDSDLKGLWGFKNGVSVDPSSTLNPKKLMPNKQMYTAQNTEIRANIFLSPLVNNNGYGLNLKVGLNQATTTGYSLTFTWSLPIGSTSMPFKTSSTSFCYIPEVV